MIILEPKVAVRRLEGLGGAEACPRKVKACPVREVSPARSPERPPLCRMRPIVEFPKVTPSTQQQHHQQQQQTVGAKSLLLPISQAERPRQKSPGTTRGDNQTSPSSTPPPAPSVKRPGPLSLSVSPSRQPLDDLQSAKVATMATESGRAPTPYTPLECGDLAQGAQGRARPRLRRLPRLDEDQGKPAPDPAPAPGLSSAPAVAPSLAGLTPQPEVKLGHLAQGGGGQRPERAPREATRPLEKVMRRPPALLDRPGKAGRKIVVNVITAGAVH